MRRACLLRGMAGCLCALLLCGMTVPAAEAAETDPGSEMTQSVSEPEAAAALPVQVPEDTASLPGEQTAPGAEAGDKTDEVDVSIDYELKKNWKRGTWVDGRYINRKGQVMADIREADMLPLPTIRGIMKKKILYVGSSRTYQASQAVDDPDVLFHWCGGSGFRWFFVPLRNHGKMRRPAYLMIRTFLAAHPDGTVIIEMGGNDLHNIEAYVGFYRELLARFPTATIWFKGILPREVGTPSNERRRAFNVRLQKEFPGHVINQYDEVYAYPDFGTIDGTHYSKELNRRIYQSMMNMIGRAVVVTASGKAVTF